MISVIIPNYNGIDHLETCLNSLFSQTYKDFNVILVDNNSADGSVEFVETHYKEVEIIKLNMNTGFAKAVNAGIEQAFNKINPSHILLLNNDVECPQTYIAEMMKGFIEKNIGCVACKMLNYYNRDTIDDCGDFIKRMGSPYARGHGQKDEGQFNKPEYIFGACAGAAIYKKEVFETLGLFDGDFFAYYEDIDFSLRMQLAGYKCYYNPMAVCYHKRGATTGHLAGFQTMLCEKNLIALRIKNYPLSLLIKYSPVFFLARIKRYYSFIRYNSFKVFLKALEGYLRGLSEIPKSLRKRKTIQESKKVSDDYLESIFTDAN